MTTYHESVIERSKDVSNSEVLSTVSGLWGQNDVFLNRFGSLYYPSKVYQNRDVQLNVHETLIIAQEQLTILFIL